MTFTSQSGGPFWGCRPAKTSEAIEVKSETNDYVLDLTPHAKFGNNRIAGGLSAYMRNITLRGKVTFFSFFFHFLERAPEQTAGRIWAIDGSKCVILEPLRPFRGHNNQIPNLTPLLPQNPKFWAIPINLK